MNDGMNEMDEMDEMNEKPRMIGGDAGATSIDPVEAARLLREARAAHGTNGGHDAGDAVDWAFASLPDRRHPRRLKVEALLRERDVEAADAMIAQGLLLRPDDPGLMFLRARSLLIQHDLLAAEREIARVLDRRPSHVSSLVVGAEIARASHEYPTGVRRLESALALRPDHDGLRARLAEILLDAEAVGSAERVILAMAEVPPRLQARLLRAQGRSLDAVELLDAARSGGDPEGDITCDLIDALESIGAVDRLHRLLDGVDERVPATLVRAGSAWLALGAYERAIGRLAPLLDHGPHERAALSVAVVAASMLGRLDLAERMLTRLQQSRAGADPRFMSELWRRAITAGLFIDQARTGRAEATREGRLIDPLLRGALAVFEAEPASRTPARRAEIQRHRALCLAALGRDREAAAALGGLPAAADADAPEATLRVAA